MRLAIVTHKIGRGDGQARVNYEIARQAADRGWQVTLVTGELAPDLQARANVIWQRICRTTKYSALAGDLYFARRSARWLRAHRGDFDVVHVNGAVTRGASDVNAAHFAHGAWLRSPVHPCRVRGGAHGAYQWLYSTLNARWEKPAFADAGIVVAVSESIRRELREIGVPDAKIRTIVNGVDLDEFRPGKEDRAALGLPPGVPLALFAGDLRLARKNLDTVLRGVARAPRLHLAVCGDARHSPYPDMAAQLDIADRVHFLGFRRDMAAIMRGCDFLAFPSRYEPFGLVLLEALASGLPVLTAQTTGGANILTPDCGAVLADAGDDAGMARIMQTWINDPARLLAMKTQARQVAQQHGWAQMADAYLRLYSEIAPMQADTSGVPSMQSGIQSEPGPLRKQTRKHD